MARRGVAGLLLGLSLLVASFAWAGFVGLKTVLDPGRSERLAEQLYDNDQVRDAMTRNMASAMGSVIPDAVPIESELLTAAALAALDHPEVEALVSEGLVDAHRQVLGEADAPATINGSALWDAAREELVKLNPELATQLPEGPDLEVTMPKNGLVNLGGFRKTLQKLVAAGAGLAAAGALAALFITSDRPRVLLRLSTWAFFAAGFWLGIGYGIPGLAERVIPRSSALVAGLVDVFFGALIQPALLLAAFAAVTLVVGLTWRILQSRSAPTVAHPQPQDPGRFQATSNIRQPHMANTGGYPLVGGPPGGAPAQAGYPGWAVQPDPTGYPDPAGYPVQGDPLAAAGGWGESAPPSWSPGAGEPRWVEGVGYLDDPGNPRASDTTPPEAFPGDPRSAESTPPGGSPSVDDATAALDALELPHPPGGEAPPEPGDSTGGH
ncbi:MAG: hypothetical protein GY929_02160 [Actinomycetia bacterium]|nr:hypothetical protein [Actinomycetes bacterium]